MGRLVTQNPASRSDTNWRQRGMSLSDRVAMSKTHKCSDTMASNDIATYVNDCNNTVKVCMHIRATKDTVKTTKTKCHKNDSINCLLPIRLIGCRRPRHQHHPPNPMQTTIEGHNRRLQADLAWARLDRVPR